jgi:hypothetical protein
VLIEEARNMYGCSIVKYEWQRPLGRYRCRWEDGTKMDLKE